MVSQPNAEAVVRARFEQDGGERTRRGARIYCLICLAMVGLSAAYSWAAESPDIALQLLAIRLMTAGAIAGVLWALSTRRGIGSSRALLVIAMLIMSLEINTLAAPASWHQGYQHERLGLVVLGTAMLATWSPAWSALGAAVVIGVYLCVSALAGRLGTSILGVELGRLAIASVVTIGAAVVRERVRWRETWQAHSFAEQHRQASQQIQRLEERSMFEARAREQEERLAHLLRVGSMGEMVAQIAHEVNQPLGAIANFANGLSARLRASGGEGELLEAANRIAAEAMRAAEVIRRIRTFVRRSEGARECADVNGLVRNAMQLVDSEMRRQGIRVQLRLAASLPPVEVDAIQVEQVIVNLLRNAIEAMSATQRRAHELLVESAANEDMLEVRVRDTGIGVAPELVEHIFDAFFTTKADGVGMGLSISRSIVESHGGKLRAERNADAGMTFVFTLPVADVTGAAGSRAAALTS